MVCQYDQKSGVFLKCSSISHRATRLLQMLLRLLYKSDCVCRRVEILCVRVTRQFRGTNCHIRSKQNTIYVCRNGAHKTIQTVAPITLLTNINTTYLNCRLLGYDIPQVVTNISEKIYISFFQNRGELITYLKHGQIKKQLVKIFFQLPTYITPFEYLYTKYKFYGL